MLGQLQQGVSVLLSDFLFLSIYSLLGVKRKLLTSRTCIQICIQCIHDAELVMKQKLRLLRDPRHIVVQQCHGHPGVFLNTLGKGKPPASTPLACLLLIALNVLVRMQVTLFSAPRGHPPS